jgi:methylthioribose-1-phosphate isomerase
VPLVVVAPPSTVDESLAPGAEIAIEERAPEVRTFMGTAITPPDADVFNPAFDVTPAELITAVVTEHGRYRPRGGQR